MHGVLLLDSYRCHMMSSVTKKIADLGIEIRHIPGGTTGLCQPIDVGIGRPFKNRIRNKWEDWMGNQDIGAGKTVAPSREMLANWIIDAATKISTQIIKNSWRHGRYSNYPEKRPLTL